MEALTKKLVEAFGPCGFEDEVRELIREEVAPYADEIEVDQMGNLYALKRGDGSGLKVAIAAHMDEIGLIATHITEEGFVRFTNLGFIIPHTLMGARVRFADGTLGVVSRDKARFVADMDKMPGVDQHFIDVGASSRDNCPVKIGTPGVIWQTMEVQGSRWIARCHDDRIGCVIGVEALKRLAETPHDVYFVFTVQEEVGTRGAATAANRIEPDVAIAVDVTPASDVIEGFPMQMKLGDGPGIKIKDMGMIAHQGLARLMQRRAEEAGIPYQPEVLLVGSTDARAMQIAGPGSAAGAISVPNRYTHTTSEVVDAADVENSVRLLVEILSRPIVL
ncbi:MAG: M20/M25/M40 family metallo-hydrolase [Anaerolineae bacterium]|nr:M20/M25/M40 family metallo-hydrolase [Anaerolineae bacterium]MCO5207204.1 M20/M25/M40 family metallo-hydrolase [Anaerolineae bacterium]